MARSTYIYIVCRRSTWAPVAAFTVKREANEWAVKSDLPLVELRMLRTRDGGYQDTRSPEGRWTRSNADFVEIPFDKS